MIAVIFEFVPAEGRRDDYLARAAALRTELEKMEGFISIERFESLMTPGKMVSISFWENDEAVARWRNHPAHSEAQAAGRAGIFRDYRLRVAEVIRDYGPDRREQAPADSR